MSEYYILIKDGEIVSKHKKLEDATSAYGDESTNFPKALIEVHVVTSFKCWDSNNNS